MARRPLERSVVAVLEGIGRRLWGFPPRLMAPIVDQLGPVPALRWVVLNLPRYERTLATFGGLRTHLLCVAISLVNGCAYCTYGHAHAVQLIYFRDHGGLFPLDQYEIDKLVGRPPDEIRWRLTGALEQAGLHSEVAMLDRTIDLLACGGTPADRDEMRIAHLVRMFGVLNRVGIASRAAPDGAHDPVNKDRLLKLCYQLMRAAPGT